MNSTEIQFKLEHGMSKSEMILTCGMYKHLLWCPRVRISDLIHCGKLYNANNIYKFSRLPALKTRKHKYFTNLSKMCLKNILLIISQETNQMP